MTLPAYLQQSQVPDFTDYADQGLGAALPPHVSIAGNCFTLIDAAGSEFEPMQTMDVCIIDRSTVTCKMYFDKPYTPGQAQNDAPACWSTNGIGPSKDAQTPQARTCAECPQNVRGSAVSKISGASIKACRDEYHFAILVPTIPDMLFRFVLTPGSFGNWQDYVAKFKGKEKISNVITRMGFQMKENGVITFQAIGYIDEPTFRIREKALLEKATDYLVGRLDTPRNIALPSSTVQQISQQVQPNPTAQPAGVSGAPIASQPSPSAVPTAQAAPISSPVGGATTASPSEPAPARRRRRTQAEIAADNQQAAGQGPSSNNGGQQAPFPVQGRTVPAGGPSTFGIAQGAPAGADPGVAQALDSFFGT